MLRFNCDYLEGAHPAIMDRLVKTNREQTTGYGFDPYTESATEKIRTICNQPDAEVHFLVGGTQANATVIDAMLRPWECVLAAKTGHIATHEAGAIEATGHKVIELDSQEGKLLPATVEKYMEDFFRDPTHDHMTQPALVYLSYPSEFGTLYSKEELKAMRNLCDRFGLALFIDGARLGYGLMSEAADVDIADIATVCDAFTIGGTKVGALFGEAVVLRNTEFAPHFFTLMKQHGAVLAKGRLLGLQFDTLFSDGLYFQISEYALEMAAKLKKGLREKGYQFHIDSPTNQQFIIMSQAKIDELADKVLLDIWEPYDERHSVVRFVTSWATQPEHIDAFIELL